MNSGGFIMIELGKMQKLIVVKKEDFGVYVGETPDAGPKERVLLPAKQVPEGCREGDEIAVFIYRDSSDRLIATTTRPLVLLHGVASLRVKEVTKIGAFLDWGLEKDLFLPFHEQTVRVRAGDQVLAALYVDKSSRLAATMKLYPYLRQDPPYRIGDQVSGTVYQVAPNFGVFIAVDGMYSGMIPKREAPADLKPGDTGEFRVTNIKAVLLKIHEEYDDLLPFDDKAEPEKIREVFGLSKAAFKRAVGRLYKEKKIVIEEGRIVVL